MTDARIDAGKPFERIGALLRATTPPASTHEHFEGHARLAASVGQIRKRAHAHAAVVGLAIAAGIAAVGLLVVRMGARPPVAWHVENGAVGAQGYVSIPMASPSARLVFDDGSDVTLAPGSRSRVAQTTALGAEVVLEQGRAHVHVEHRDRSQWLVDAGPFSVRVTGTEFSIAWAADSETLDVWMRRGRVVIQGPVLGDALTLSAGQHVRARLPDATVQIDGAPESSDQALNEQAVRSSEARALSTTAPVVEALVATPPTSSDRPTWPVLVAAGNFARVVREAHAQDSGRALASRPLADLRALGDAARYAGDPVLANRAFLAMRTRFPTSAEARTAAFLLGRVAEEQQHANADALRWYETYLDESPDGPLAGDALGRKMLIASKSLGPEGARPLAERYLQRFPSGPYAAAARDLTR